MVASAARVCKFGPPPGSPIHLLGPIALLLSACSPEDPTPGDTWAGAAGDTAAYDGGEVEQPDDTGEPDPTPVLHDIVATVDPDFGTIIHVEWDQSLKGTVSFRYQVDEGEWLESPAQTLGTGRHEQLLLGVPYSWEVEIQPVAEIDGDLLDLDSFTVTTGTAPEDLPQPDQVLRQAELLDPTPYVMISTNVPGAWDKPWWTMIIDRQARVVWARKSSENTSTLYAKLSADERSLIIDETTFWTLFDQGAKSTVVRVAIDGTELERFSTPGLHHDFADLPDGTLLWGSSTQITETLMERAPDGSSRAIWTCTTDEFQGVCSSNAVYWDAATDSVYFSLVSGHSIVQLDRESGLPLRWFGAHPEAYAFDPFGSQFYKQHGPILTATGTLLLSCWDGPEGSELMLREYEIDGVNQTLRQVWSYSHGTDLRAYVLGDVARLPGGNTLHSTGRGSRLREVTPEGDLAWDLAWDESSDLGRATPLADLYALLPDES